MKGESERRREGGGREGREELQERVEEELLEEFISYLSLCPPVSLFDCPSLDILASLLYVAKATAARRPPLRSSIRSVHPSLEFVLQVNLGPKNGS